MDIFEKLERNSRIASDDLGNLMGEITELIQEEKDKEEKESKKTEVEDKEQSEDEEGTIKKTIVEVDGRKISSKRLQPFSVLKNNMEEVNEDSSLKFVREQIDVIFGNLLKWGNNGKYNWCSWRNYWFN